MLVDSLEQKIEELDGNKFRQMLISATQIIKENEEEINDLNIFPVPDGDTGTNMYLTLSNAVDEVKNVEDNKVGTIADKLAMGALMGARGNSGVILSQLLRGLADGIGDAQVLTSQNLAAGLQQASNRAYQAVMKPVEGTILTVAKEVGERAKERADELDVLQLLDEVVKQAEETVDKTPELLATLKEAGVVDAGGRGYQMFLVGLLKGVVAKEDFIQPQVKLERVTKERVQSANSEFGYCTEFIIKGAKIEVDEFREELTEYGDCLLVVKTADILKVHIHTAHPGQVLEEGLKYGQLSRIKIDNMSEEHEERLKAEIADEVNDDSKSKENEVEDEEVSTRDNLAILAVAVGEGLGDIFKKIGVSYVLQGGQSMNPSIQDLLQGVEEISADQVIILPNNKNVISTAEQIKDLTDKEISVIPTRTIPQGVAAMMMFNPEGEIKEVSEAMKEEVEFVKTGEITYAVRDTQIRDLTIEEGDILGLAEGNIEVVGSDYNQATLDLLDKIVQEDDSLITLYVGKEVNEAEKEELEDRLQEEYPDFDIEIYNGRQPIYYYIISVE